AMIVEGRNVRHLLFHFSKSAAVNVRHSHYLNVRNRHDFFQQVLAAVAHADHANAHSVISAEHTRGRVRKKYGRSSRSLLQEFTSSIVCHVSALVYAPAFRNNSFM